MTRFLTAAEAAEAIRKMNRSRLREASKEKYQRLTQASMKLELKRQQHLKQVRERKEELLAELKARREAAFIFTEKEESSELGKLQKTKRRSRPSIDLDGMSTQVTMLEPPKPWAVSSIEAGKEYISFFRAKGKLYFKTFLCKARSTKDSQEFVSLALQDPLLQGDACCFVAAIDCLHGSEFAVCFTKKRVPWRIFAMLDRESVDLKDAVPA